MSNHQRGSGLETMETEDQITFLHSSGCDEGQGYLVSEPLPAEKFQKLVAARH